MNRHGFVRALSVLIVLSGFVTNAHASMGKHTATGAMHDRSQFVSAGDNDTRRLSGHFTVTHFDGHPPDAHSHRDASTHSAGDGDSSLSGECCDVAVCAAPAATLPSAGTTFPGTIEAKTFDYSDLVAGLQPPPPLRPPR